MAKERGWLLTSWLILMLLFSVFGLFSGLLYLFGMGPYVQVYTGAPWPIYVYEILGLLNIVFTVFLFKWKKWPFYAYCGSGVVAAILNIIMGVGGIISTLSALVIPPLILYLIMRPKWDLFE